MKSYIDLAGLEAVVLEESFVLGIHAAPGAVMFDIEFALTPEHPLYAPPSPHETECFRGGVLQFRGVQRLVWDDQGPPPATDASGEVDFGHVDVMSWSDGFFKLEGDWGRMEVHAARTEVEIHE